MPTVSSAPAPAARPAWKDALFNYGTLVLTVVAVLGTMFAQLYALREQGARLDERLGSLEKRVDERFGGLEKRIDERFGRIDERFGSVEKRLDKNEQRLEQVQATLVEHGLLLQEIAVELRRPREQKKP